MRAACFGPLVSLRAAAAAVLLRVSAWLGFTSAPSTGGLTLDSPIVESMREAQGGQLSAPPTSQTRWYLSDLESAERAADSGSLATLARLMRAARKDGVLAGVLSTRTGGLVRLPKRFRGRADIVEALEVGHRDATRSVFDEMFPATELALLAADGILCGVGGGELVRIEGRDYPLFVRYDPEFFEYRWAENRWYFRSIAGPIAITPGDGRWILHTPGGRQAPWSHGLWKAIGRAFIRKEHANLYKDAWEAKLANPARVAVAPAGAAEEQAQSWWRAVMAWGVNTVFGLRPGYDVRLLESNGRGYDSFVKTIADQNNEIVIAVAGQTVTTDGGAGFQNSDIHKSIRADLIKETADGLAFTINTQGLPVWIVERFGEDALEDGCVVEWDVTPPKDRNAEASALVTIAQAIKQLAEATAGHDQQLDVGALLTRFGVPMAAKPSTTTGAATVDDVTKVIELARGARLQPTADSLRKLAERMGLVLEAIPQGETQPKRLELAPTDLAKVVKAKEARLSQGLEPFGDDRDEKTITQLGEEAAPAALAEEEASKAPPLKEAA